ncbi:MAG: type II toxin-antitoxin system mRNA interferase toxin, RelE/StbE family [Candidatus Shapirobacteria bacterium]
MTKIKFTKNFKKLYRKLPRNLQTAFDKRLGQFIDDRNNPILNLHRLKGKLSHLYSINVSGDCRALYSINEDLIIFQLIGTHSQLYR